MPTMPTEMALPLYMAKDGFFHRTTPKTCKPALRFQQPHRVDLTQPDGGENTGKAKKQVTFADHRGLSLTKVKVFSQLNDPIQIPVHVQLMLSSAASRTAEDKLVLDFPQPSSDYLLFRQRLDKNYVCLERCVLSDKMVAGTVKVKNVCFQKRVRLRVTSDCWKSHSDEECTYLEETYPSSCSDTFSFEFSLPKDLQPWHHVEFAVCYEVEGCEHWDSNNGDNYRIVWSSRKESYLRGHNHGHGKDSLELGIHFDPYGSPTCSHGIFPDWPSYSRCENMGPYY